MKALFALRSAPFARFFDTLFRDMRAAGHTVEVVCQIYRPNHPEPDSPDAWLKQMAADTGFRCERSLRRADRWQRYLFASRNVLNYAIYLRPGLQASNMVLQRHADYLPLPLRGAARHPLLRAGLRLPGVVAALRLFERAAPPDPGIVRWLQANRPDVVIAAPVLMPGTEEVEYIKAAAALHIPTVIAVMSWDNLTTKGVFYVRPDLTLVWNQSQVDEAVTYHDIAPDKIVYTGAPVFDDWFALRPALSREAFCRQAGLDPARRYLLYLCSSNSIAQDETGYVEEVVRGLRRHAATRDLDILVRPHPWNAKIWQAYASEGFVVWPRKRVVSVTPEVRQGLYHSICYSEGVLGINTSGFIEAAILDKPCITILAERYHDTQQDISHFQHLLRSGFLEVAHDIAEAGQIIAAHQQGGDHKHDQRRRFIQNFIRPWGLHLPAGRSMITAIAAAAQRRTASQIAALLSADSTAQALDWRAAPAG